MNMMLSPLQIKKADKTTVILDHHRSKRVIAILDKAGGSLREFSYDIDGRVDSYTDRGYKLTRVRHLTGCWTDGVQKFALTIDVDSLGTVTIVDSANGCKTYIKTNGAYVVVVSHHGGTFYAIERTADGLITQITYVDGTQRTFNYDENGVLSTVSDAQGSWERVGSHWVRYDTQGNYESRVTFLKLTRSADLQIILPNELFFVIRPDTVFTEGATWKVA